MDVLPGSSTALSYYFVRVATEKVLQPISSDLETDKANHVMLCSIIQYLNRPCGSGHRLHMKALD